MRPRGISQRASRRPRRAAPRRRPAHLGASLLACLAFPPPLRRGDGRLPDRQPEALRHGGHHAAADGGRAAPGASLLIGGLLWPIFSLVLAPEASQQYHLYFRG